jgi:hypothetical protein
MVRSVAVLALIAAATAVGCATTEPPVDRHIVPPTLTSVTLEDFEGVNGLDVDLHTAVQTREAIESEFSRGYLQQGHMRWFFHAFDGQYLDFVVARYEPVSGGSSRYVAQTLLRVKRTPDAEVRLGVTDVVRDQAGKTPSTKRIPVKRPKP